MDTTRMDTTRPLPAFFGVPGKRSHLRLSRLTGVALTVLVMAIGLGVMRAGAETVKFTYDERGRLTGVAYGSSSSIQYEYDAAGNVVTVRETVIGMSDEASDAGDADNLEPLPPQSMTSAATATDDLMP